MPAPKAGALTRDELLGVWGAAVDAGYREPLVAAGEGGGLEVVTQMLEQMATGSDAVDVSSQAMFIVPWSGQTNPPAEGAARATVTLTLERSGLVNLPLVLRAGQVLVEEETEDWGPDGAVVVRTGRLFALAEDLVFHPGDVGPFDVPAVAERVGYGHNFPLPGTLRLIPQPGARFENDEAVINFQPQATVGGSPATTLRVLSDAEADMFVPEHVGQYVMITTGVNAGRIARVATFEAPLPPVSGSAVTAPVEHSFESFAFAGAFLPGEAIQFDSGGPVLGTGMILGERIVGASKKVTYELLSGAEGTTATGVTSGATATVDVMLASQLYVDDPSAAWRVLGWADDWGLRSTNVGRPSGGRAGMLDVLGRERAIDRAPGEPDSSYRERVKAIADVVSPNAIRRALYRVLGATPFCFREVGSSFLPGFFFDGDASPPSAVPHGAANDAFDTDVIVMTGAVTLGTFQFHERVVLETVPGGLFAAGGYFGRLDGGFTFTLIRTSGAAPPAASLAAHRVRGLVSGATFAPALYVATPTVAARRFHVLLDYEQFRAFFLVGVPRSSAGEFGFAYDAFPTGAYDASPWLAFYDGSPAEAAALWQRVYQAVETVRAGGVGWQLYVEDVGCP